MYGGHDMKKSLPAVAALLAFTAPAAAVTMTSSYGAPDPGLNANEVMVVTFDAPAAAGYSWTGGIQTASTSVTGVAAAPAGDASVFGYVSAAETPSWAVLKTPDLKSISFYWGSIDVHNKVQVLDPLGAVLATFDGSAFMPHDGNWFTASTNRRVWFSAGAGETIGGLRLSTTGVAFEFDDFAAAVPEPATWAMLLSGFALVGVAARRRRAGAVTHA